MSFEITPTNSIDSMRKIVGVLGAPQALRVEYSSNSYGELEDNLRSVFGESSGISREFGYPVQTVLRNKEGPAVSVEKFIDLYSLSVERDRTGVSPILLLSDGTVMSAQEYQDREEKPDEKLSAVMLKDVRWEFPEGNLMIVGGHYKFGARHRGVSQVLLDLQEALISEGIEHSIATYNSHNDFNDFVTSWK